MPAPRWMSQAACEEFSWSQTLGGTRGVIETSAPGLIFVIVYVATHALVPTSSRPPPSQSSPASFD